MTLKLAAAGVPSSTPVALFATTWKLWRRAVCLESVYGEAQGRKGPLSTLQRKLELPSVVVPESAVDAQSLIAASDLVVSAGGTMNREAAALGVPVYTTYGGRLGGVDESLIRDGRLVPLTDPRALRLEKRGETSAPRVRRDPADMLALLLSALD